jgi:hypothetical protein
VIGKKRGPKLDVSDLEKRVNNVEKEVKQVIENIIQTLDSKAGSSQSDLTPKNQGRLIDLISSSATSQLRSKPDPLQSSQQSTSMRSHQ